MNPVYVQEGKLIDYTATADAAVGEVVVQGDLVGVCSRALKAGDRGALAVCGVFDLPKAAGAGTAIPVGSRMFWDAAAKVATGNDGGGANKYLGKSIKAAADADDAVRVRLSQ